MVAAFIDRGVYISFV